MPLRDHFHPPLDDESSWEGIHGQWPAMIVLSLSSDLPERYVAEPRVHFGASVEIDVATFQKNGQHRGPSHPADGNGVATAIWAPPTPTLAFATDLPANDEYEVLVFEGKRRRLVAAVEIVSPANKDRPEHRRAFVAKCLALLARRVSVTIIDLVTSRNFNLYADLLAMMGHEGAAAESDHGIYAAANRVAQNHDAWRLESWAAPLAVGESLPTLPLWLADDLAIPLDLETTYEETCRILRIAT